MVAVMQCRDSRSPALPSAGGHQLMHWSCLVRYSHMHEHPECPKMTEESSFTWSCCVDTGEDAAVMPLCHHCLYLWAGGNWLQSRSVSSALVPDQQLQQSWMQRPLCQSCPTRCLIHMQPLFCLQRGALLMSWSRAEVVGGPCTGMNATLWESWPKPRLYGHGW